MPPLPGTGSLSATVSVVTDHVHTPTDWPVVGGEDQKPKNLLYSYFNGNCVHTPNGWPEVCGEDQQPKVLLYSYSNGNCVRAHTQCFLIRIGV